jgi:hypothetical protein
VTLGARSTREERRRRRKRRRRRRRRREVGRIEEYGSGKGKVRASQKIAYQRIGVGYIIKECLSCNRVTEV